MIFRYPNYVSLGGVELTDESRQPVPVTLDQRKVELELANGRLKKYIKANLRL